MSNDLSALEEFDAQRKIQFPHLLHEASSLSDKKNIAYVVLAKSADEILLVSPSGFGEATVIAGMTEKNTEHLVKFAPREYKENLVSAIADSYLLNDVWEIVSAMDDDEGNVSTKNQDRIKNVIQYIKDNRAAFQF